MFIYAPNTRQAARKNRLSEFHRVGFSDWLAKRAEATVETRKTHRFQIQDGRVSPSRVAGRTTDTWIIPKTVDESLWVQGISNPPWTAPSNTEVHRVLTRPEPTTIKVMPTTGNAQPAYILVLDHPVAQVTNRDGAVVFDALPVGVDIPLMVSAPQMSGFSIHSKADGVEVQGSRIVVYSADAGRKELDLFITNLNE